MFDDLTPYELAELTDKLCNAMFDARHRLVQAQELVTELQEVEHAAWHTRCAKTGVRCMQCATRQLATA